MKCQRLILGDDGVDGHAVNVYGNFKLIIYFDWFYMSTGIDIRKYLQKIIARQDLTANEMSSVFDLVMEGRLTPAQIAALISTLRMKGESVDEITGAALAMRRHAVKIDAGGLPVVDTCGTGGDGGNTFNISTAAAFVVAGAGVPVAKHGNRAVSSQCGSADVLAELGVNLEAPPEAIEECIRTVGIGFLFAPKMHPAMKHAATSTAWPKMARISRKTMVLVSVRLVMRMQV